MASKEKRFEWKLKGLCPECGGERDRDEFYMCSKCSEQKKKRRLRKIESKICVNCGNPAVEGATLCEKCKELKHANAKEAYNAKRQRRVCTVCGMKRAAPKKTMCEMCLAKTAERQINYYHNMPDGKKAEKYRDKCERQKRKREYAKENGICTICLSKKATTGYLTCIECRTKARLKERNRSIAQGAKSYEYCIENGICTRCHREKATKGKVCDACYDYLYGHIKKARSKMDFENHYWVQDNTAVFFCKINGTGV